MLLRDRPFALIAMSACLPAAVIAVAACEPPRPPSAPALAPSASAPATDAALKDTGWARFNSKRFDLELALPDGKAWRIDDHRSPWLVASHATSSTTLRVRVWRELELASRDRCEQRAREWAPDLPSLVGARVIDDGPLPAVPAPGFDTRVVAAIAQPKAPDAVDGFVIAFGASGKKCFAYAWVATARGPGAAERIGDRLGTGVRTLEGAFIVSDLAPPREAPPTKLER